MTWEKRSKNNYYYRKVRRGAKVSSVYLGNDIHAYIYTGELQRQKMQSQRQRALLNSETVKEHVIEDNHKAIIALAEAVMLLNGYHQHKGQWRKRHGK
jgi:hypothetical protein